MADKYQIFLEDLQGNWAELEIDNIELNTTFSIQDIADISKRNDTISKSITIKGTKNNNLAFGNLYRLDRYVTTDNTRNLFEFFKPNYPVNCGVYVNNIQIIKGKFIVDEINEVNGTVNYTANITGVTVGFFNSLSDKKTTDLTSLKTLQHTYTMSHAVSTWNSPYTSYVYPIIDYGYASTAPHINYQNIRTGIYLKTYIDAIFRGFDVEEDGTITQPIIPKYEVVGSILDEPEFKNAFIPYNDKQFAMKYKGLFATGTASPNNSLGNARSQYPVWVDGITGIDKYTTQSQTTLNLSGGFDDIYTVLNLKSEVQTAIKMTFTFDIEWNGVAAEQTVRFGVFNPVDGYNTDSFLGSYYTRVVNGTGGDTNQSLEVELPFNTYNQPFTFGVYQTSSSGGISRIKVTAFTIEFGDEDLTSIIPIKLGDTISLYDVLPADINIKDLLKSILATYNLYLMEDPDKENRFILEPYNQFYEASINPVDIAIDWSGKVDLSEKKIQTNSSLPKSYIYKFKEDGDYLNTDYRNKYNDTYGNYQLNDSIGTAESKTIDIIFSPTVVAKESGDDKLKGCLYQVNNGAKQPFKSNIRIMVFNGARECGLYNIEGDGININTYYGYASMTAANINLFFGVPKEKYSSEPIELLPTIYNKYYADQIKELTDNNLVLLTVNVSLNEVDINQLDLRLPVFISTDLGDSYYKIINIEYINNSYLSTVTLQRII